MTGTDSGRYDFNRLRTQIPLVTFSVIMIICSSQDKSSSNSNPKLLYVLTRLILCPLAEISGSIMYGCRLLTCA